MEVESVTTYSVSEKETLIAALKILGINLVEESCIPQVAGEPRTLTFDKKVPLSLVAYLIDRQGSPHKEVVKRIHIGDDPKLLRMVELIDAEVAK